jgi:spermidine/putrescine transport system substrate-binding protein
LHPRETPALSRRRFVMGAGVAAIAACDRGGRPRGAGLLRFGNRPFYIDGDTLPAFERETGITVEYHEDAVDDGALAAALAARRSLDRDVIVVRDQVAARLAAATLVQPFAAVPDGLRSSLARPGRRQVPWAVGVTGLAVRRGTSVTSLRDLAGAAPKLALLRGPSETIGLALLLAGSRLARVTPAELTAAAATVARWRDAGAVVVDSVYDAGLGEPDGAAIAVADRGDVAQLVAEGVEVDFVVPAEGSVVWTDDLVIPKDASNPDGASRLAAFIYRPAISQRLFGAVPFTSPVDGVGALPPGAQRLRDLTTAEAAEVAKVLE